MSQRVEIVLSAVSPHDRAALENSIHSLGGIATHSIVSEYNQVVVWKEDSRHMRYAGIGAQFRCFIFFIFFFFSIPLPHTNIYMYTLSLSLSLSNCFIVSLCFCLVSVLHSSFFLSFFWHLSCPFSYNTSCSISRYSHLLPYSTYPRRPLSHISFLGNLSAMLNYFAPWPLVK